MPEPTPLVLVIENHQDTREMYGSFLQAFGFDVVLIGDGNVALAKAVELAPAAIVMDLSMPGFDGLSACRQLKSDSRTAQTPIIVVTGHVSAENEQRVIASGADAFLRKPVALERLLDELRKLIRAA